MTLLGWQAEVAQNLLTLTSVSLQLLMDVVPLLRCITDREAINMGIFLYETLRLLNFWRSSEKVGKMLFCKRICSILALGLPSTGPITCVFVCVKGVFCVLHRRTRVQRLLFPLHALISCPAAQSPSFNCQRLLMYLCDCIISLLAVAPLS